MVRRIIFFLFLFYVAEGVFAQGIQIERSSEVVMLAGKSYYIHKVQPGQTLFSICKAYGVKLEEVMALNNKKDSALSLGEVLRIPVVQPFVRVDKKYYYHRMRPKETLYSLSRRFGIKLKRILRDNPEYSEKTPIAQGAVVRLSLKAIDKMALQAELNREDSQEMVEADDLRKGDETMVNKEKDIVILPKEEEKLISDTLQVVEENKTYIPHNVRIALLLPLYLEGNKLPDSGMFSSDTLKQSGIDERWRLNSKSELFMQFYEGVLLALDSLKTMGYTVDLHVYDTHRDIVVASRLAGELNVLKPDLIIGPIYADVFRIVAEQLFDKTIPMIFPLSAQLKGLEHFPNLIQMNAREEVLMEDLIKWLVQNINIQENKYIQIIPEVALNKKWSGSNFVSSIREKLPDESRHLILDYYWNKKRNIDSLRVILDEHKENVIFLPTMSEAVISQVLPVLSSLTDRYRLTLVGFPEWLKFTSVDEDIYFKLNTRMFTNYYLNVDSIVVEDFMSRFRNCFYEEPGNIAVRSFDMVMYFVPLIDIYRNKLLEELPAKKQDGLFTRFYFQRMENGKVGMENRGLYMINYNRDYSIVVTPVQ